MWAGGIIFFTGCVNEFKYENLGGALGAFYKNNIYEVFPYYGIVFFVCLLTYAYLLRFPYKNVLLLTTELIGESIISFLEYINIQDLLSKFKVPLYKRKKEVVINFENIQGETYLSTKEVEHIDDITFDIEKVNPIAKSVDIEDDKKDIVVLDEIVNTDDKKVITPDNDDVFVQFGEGIAHLHIFHS